MTLNSDPFRHHPELKGKVINPLISGYRDMNIEQLDEKMHAVGAQADWRHSDAHRENSRRETLNGRRKCDFWIFAYGSLMWDPGFRFSEVRTAMLKGYQRSFCLKSELGRGTSDKPGLIAGLDNGGECRGLAFQIDRKLIDEETRIIWKREMLRHAYTPKFARVETPMGNIEALTFVVDHNAKNYCPGMSLEETVHHVATGVGIFGSSLAYVESLAEHLEVIGIDDDALFQLRNLARLMTTTLRNS